MDQATNPRKQSLSIRRAIRHGLLGKESLLDECHYAGSDAYWDEAMEAQLGWPHGQVQRRPADDRRADEARARAAGELHYEPVYGMTSRQLHEWLTRNAQLKPAYESELRRIRTGTDRFRSPSGGEIPRS